MNESLLSKFDTFLAEQKRLDEGNGRQRILFFDGLNTYLRCFCSTPTLNDDGSHVGGVTGFLMSMAATIRMLRPHRCVVVFDGAGGSQRRRQLYPEYKASRKTMTRLNRTYDFGSIEEEHKSRNWQLSLLAAILRTLPVTVVCEDLVEADDVIAYLVRANSERGGDSYIVSTDKDFLQCVNASVMVYNPVKKRMYDPDAVVTDYGFHPSNFLWYRAITGDKSDCIDGVDGIKEKTLLKYFPSLATDEVHSLDGIFERVDSLLTEAKKPPVALQTLSKARSKLERNVKLMRLDDVAMSGTTRMRVMDKFDAPVAGLNKYELTKLLQYHKLFQAFKNFDHWVLNSFTPLTRHLLNNG